jgi:hypothetical protein
MISVLASIVVDHEFDPRSGQSKDNNSGICCLSDNSCDNSVDITNDARF